ncbi:MAG: hypothetical protein R3E89_09925 [Thiolinea sp.]
MGNDNVAEFWQTDGSNKGTQRLLRVPFGEYENYAPPFEFAGQVYFFGVTDANNPYRVANAHNPAAALWRTDGTVAGTQPVALPHIPNAYDRLGPYALLNDKLLFVSSKNWPDTQQANWLEVVDATQPGKIEAVTLGQFERITLFARQGENLGQGPLFFAVHDQLWQTDGTPAGTRPMGDFGLPAPAASDYNPGGIYWTGTLPVRLDNGTQLLTYSDQPTSQGDALWVIDTSAKLQRLANINPMPGNSKISNLTPTGKGWYFLKDDTALWYSDGTAKGTVPVKGLAENQKPQPAYASSVAFRDQYYVLTQSDTEKTINLWRAENGQATRMHSWPKPTGGYATGKHLYAGDKHLYLLDDTQENGWQLFSSDGTNLEDTPILQGDAANKTRFVSLTGLEEGFLYTLESLNPITGGVANPTRTLWYYDHASKQTSAIPYPFTADQLYNVTFHNIQGKVYALQAVANGSTYQLLAFDPARKSLVQAGSFAAGDPLVTTWATSNGFFFLWSNPQQGDQLWFMDVGKQPIKAQWVKQFDPDISVELTHLDGGQYLYLNSKKRTDADMSGDANTLWVTDGTPAGTRELVRGVEISYY